MNFIWDKITEWLKGLLVSGIMSNLTGLFESINGQVTEIAANVGKTPQAWNGSIFSMIRTLSENVVVPIAGIILTFVMCLELIQMLIDRNNMHDFDTFIFFKWLFKTAAAVLIVTNTWNIVMGVFDVAQSVVNSAAGSISSNTAIDINAVVTSLETRLKEMDIGPLFGMWFRQLPVESVFLRDGAGRQGRNRAGAGCRTEKVQVKPRFFACGGCIPGRILLCFARQIPHCGVFRGETPARGTLSE